MSKAQFSFMGNTLIKQVCAKNQLSDQLVLANSKHDLSHRIAIQN